MAAKKTTKKHAKGVYLRGKTWWASATHPSTGRGKLLSLDTSDQREATQVPRSTSRIERTQSERP